MSSLYNYGMTLTSQETLSTGWCWTFWVVHCKMYCLLYNNFTGYSATQDMTEI